MEGFDPYVAGVIMAVGTIGLLGSLFQYSSSRRGVVRERVVYEDGGRQPDGLIALVDEGSLAHLRPCGRHEAWAELFLPICHAEITGAAGALAVLDEMIGGGSATTGCGCARSPRSPARCAREGLATLHAATQLGTAAHHTFELTSGVGLVFQPELGLRDRWHRGAPSCARVRDRSAQRGPPRAAARLQPGRRRRDGRPFLLRGECPIPLLDEAEGLSERQLPWYNALLTPGQEPPWPPWSGRRPAGRVGRHRPGHTVLLRKSAQYHFRWATEQARVNPWVVEPRPSGRLIRPPSCSGYDYPIGRGWSYPASGGQRRGEAEDPLGDDVPLDLAGSPGNRPRERPQVLVGPRPGRHDARPAGIVRSMPSGPSASMATRQRRRSDSLPNSFSSECSGRLALEEP